MGLQEYLKSRDISQKELAQKSGVPRQTINGLCTGARKMDDLTLRNAAKIGDVLIVSDLRDFLDN